MLSSSRKRRRWFSALDQMDFMGVELDRDLWPAFGHVLTMTFQEAPENLTLSQYGWITGRIAFDGKNKKAHDAMNGLAAGVWDMAEAGESNSPPYVRRVDGKHAERYMLFTKFILAPTWTVSNSSVSFVSDGGPFVLLKKNRDAEQEQFPIKHDTASYYIHLDGMRMAAKIEAWASLHYQDEEEELGAKEFSQTYADVPARIRLAQKLTRLLGEFSLSVAPRKDKGKWEGGGRVADLKAAWTPGTLSGMETKAKSEEDAPPPPR